MNQDSEGAAGRGPAIWNVLALGLAAIAVGGSVYLSVGMGLKACPLCFYQRSFAIAVVLVLPIMLWQEGLRSTRASLVALPLIATGLGVAAFHVYLVQANKLECPPAVFGLGDGPLQSLAVFAALTFVSVIGACSSHPGSRHRAVMAITTALLLGGVAAWACIASSPPLPPTPTQPYDAVEQPFEMCRPPYRTA